MCWNSVELWNYNIHLDSRVLWQWCITLKIIHLLNFVLVSSAFRDIRNELHNDDTLTEGIVLQVKAIVEPQICKWTINSSSRKLTYLWEALHHPLLATSAWSILRKWLLTQHNTNRCCGSVMWMTHCGQASWPQNGYRIFPATLIVQVLSSNSLWK